MIEKKYIITEYGGPVIFDSLIYHFELGLDAVSAGFVKIWTDSETEKVRVSCYGESRTMGLASDPPRDEKIIEEFLNME